MIRFLVLLLALTACGPTGNKIAIDLKACAVGNISNAASAILPTVSLALTSGDWQTLLTNLVTSVGAPVVECAVEAIINDLSHGAPTPQSATIVANGKAWLASQGIK